MNFGPVARIKRVRKIPFTSPHTNVCKFFNGSPVDSFGSTCPHGMALHNVVHAFVVITEVESKEYVALKCWTFFAV